MEFDNFVKETKDFPDTIFHNYFDALQGKPAPKMDLSQFKPVSQEVINKLSIYETQMLVMMSRIDFKEISIEAKRHLYHQYIDYWYNVLTILKPDVLIFLIFPIQFLIQQFIISPNYWISEQLLLGALMVY